MEKRLEHTCLITDGTAPVVCLACEQDKAEYEAERAKGLTEIAAEEGARAQFDHVMWDGERQ